MTLRFCRFCGLDKDEERDFYPVRLYPSSRCISCEKSRARGVSVARHSDPAKIPKIRAKRKARESADSFREVSRSRDRLRYAKRRRDDSVALSSERASYFQRNKAHINRYNLLRKKDNPVLRLRGWVSGCVWSALRSQGGTKRGQSVMDFLPYSIEELRSHLDSHPEREPWMTWENWGSYSPVRKTWQVDHIVPQFALPYSDMSHPNFVLCWSLSNLRPLESMENLRKGGRLLSIP